MTKPVFPLRRVPLLAALLLVSTLASAFDRAELAEVFGRVERGKMVELASGDAPVLALYTEETRGDLKGGVILLHDLGAHADWPEIIRPLRGALPDSGWTTLSVQMPPGPAQETEQRLALLGAARSRIDAALEYLSAQGIRNVVLLGHGLGALAAADYLRTYRGEAVRGLVAVGVTDYSGDPRLAAPTALAGVGRPLLDIYGSRDLPPVLAAAPRRAEVIRKRILERLDSAEGLTEEERKRYRSWYRQIAVPGADHGFTGQEPLLIRRVSGWLKRYATGVRIRLEEEEEKP